MNGSGVRNFAFVCAMSGSFGLLGIPTANAVTFNLGLLAPGPLGTTQAYTVGGVTITAAGFSSASALAGAPNVGLFGKTGAGDETGLGLQNDMFGEDEISGTSLVQINATGLTNVSFAMNSVTTSADGGGPEAWEVWGSNSATALGAPIAFGSDEGVSHSLPSFDFYNFAAQFFANTNGNVLISSIDASPVPLPPAIFLFGTALAGLGAFIVRRRRKEGSALQAV